MSIENLKLPKKNEYKRRNQISSPIDPDVYERFQTFSRNHGHGTKKILIETALTKLLDELERK